MPGVLVAFSPSSPRQVFSRCLRPAGVTEMSLTEEPARVGPPIGLRQRCVPVVLVASPVASASHTPKSVLKGAFQSLKRAVWREKFMRLARLLPPEPLPEIPPASQLVHKWVAERRN